MSSISSNRPSLLIALKITGFDLNNFEDMQDRGRALKQTLTDIKALSSGDELQDIQDLFKKLGKFN